LTLEQLRSRPTITVPELADVFEIGRNQAYELVRRGDVESIRIGTRIVVPTPPLLRMLGAEPIAADPDMEITHAKIQPASDISRRLRNTG
jgi:hypothetical protein